MSSIDYAEKNFPVMGSLGTAFTLSIKMEAWLTFIIADLVFGTVVGYLYLSGFALSGLLLAIVFALFAVVHGFSCASFADKGGSEPNLTNTFKAALSPRYFPGLLRVIAKCVPIWLAIYYSPLLFGNQLHQSDVNIDHFGFEELIYVYVQGSVLLFDVMFVIVILIFINRELFFVMHDKEYTKDQARSFTRSDGLFFRVIWLNSLLIFMIVWAVSFPLFHSMNLPVLPKLPVIAALYLGYKVAFEILNKPEMQNPTHRPLDNE